MKHIGCKYIFNLTIASSKFNGVGSWNLVLMQLNYLINVYKVDVLRQNKDIIFQKYWKYERYADKN